MMSDLNVSLILRLVDKASAPARTAMRALQRIGGEDFARRASQISKGAGLMKTGLVGMAGAARTGATALALYSGAMAGLAVAFIRPAAQFERFNVQLTTLEGSAEGAKRAMSWIEDFATRTPLEMDQTVQAYAKLKAFGIDPTTGALQASVDTMAAVGGGAEQLDGIVLALGQAWTKQKLQGEEAMQLLERGVPVWDLLAKKLGKTTAEVQEMATAGDLGRKEIGLLIEAMGEANRGASDNMSKTWDGIISNLVDYWSKFQRMVMGSGVFDFLKSRLQIFLDLLNRMAADGRLQAWADSVAQAIMVALTMIWNLGTGIVAVWQAAYPWLQAAADALGSWERLALAITALGFSRTLIAIAVAAVQFGRGALMAGQAILWMGGMVVRAGLMLMANPLFLAIAAIGAAVYVIYDNWNGIVAYFQGKIDAVRAAFDQGLLNGVLKALSEFNPFRMALEGAVNLVEYLTGMDLSPVTAAIEALFDYQKWFDAGVRLIQALWDGIKSLVGQMADWVKAKVAGIIPEMPWWLKGSQSDVVAAAPNRADVAGGRALGGPVRAGRIYRWQENGLELFSPGQDGNVISAPAVRSMRSAAARVFRMGDIVVNAAPGQSAEAIAKAVRREMERLARAAGMPLHDGGAYADH